MKTFKTRHAIREEWVFRIIFAVTVSVSIYSLSYLHTQNLKKEMTIAFVDSVTHLEDAFVDITEINEAFKRAEAVADKIEAKETNH